jgi:hypothetical protein
MLRAVDGAPRPLKPRLDAGGNLWYGRAVVLKFHKSISHPRVVVEAFQRDGWPEVRPNPLVRDGEHGRKPRRRLHDTVQKLNASRLAHCLRFFLTDCGLKVGWKPCEESAPIGT